MYYPNPSYSMVYSKLLLYHGKGIRITGAREAQAPCISTGGPCPYYFVSWPLLIEVTKDEFKHMTHKEVYEFEICIFVCQINHKAQNMYIKGTIVLKYSIV